MTFPRSPLSRSIAVVLAVVPLLITSSCTDEQNQHKAIGSARKSPAKALPKPRPGSYKNAHKTKNPSHVISPYPPHNLIDISRNPKTGEPFRKGDFAKDPSNGQIFRIP